ncbi:hypothetical protein [Nocardia transvalensis]|uniref:hypothetical protein n=1 Tax=Nocardia transvalensis TaxID=37333 RepID=UPI001893BB61|nr:hypothetical protein [Nocardia transvalensis]MBF6333421.1 hypothetical protein [Nocardia transvalensis]
MKLSSEARYEGISVYWALIGPAEAREILSRNPRNRKVRKLWAAQIAKDQEAGRWEINGDTVRFDEDGNLIDGQHRMTAVEQSGIPQVFLVVEGLPRATQKTMDKNSRRTAADGLFMDRGEGGKEHTAIGRAILAWNGVNKPTDTQIIAFTDENFDSISHALDLARPVNKEFGGGIARYALASYLLTCVDPIGAEAFAYLLATGDGLRKGHPVYLLRDRLRKENLRVNANDRKSLEIVLKPMFTAWNLWRSGEGFRQFLRLPEECPVPR